MVKGLDAFSHIWVHFLFHETVTKGWRPTIRPPVLGGKKRVGIFASRSPHRPNHLGISAVRLSGIEDDAGAIFLCLQGVDFLDQTPVVDIKPYIPYSDSVGEAKSGFTRPPTSFMNVLLVEEVEAFCRQYEIKSGRPIRRLIKETIGCDPRPASHRPTQREYGMLLWNVNVRFVANKDHFLVTGVEYRS